MVIMIQRVFVHSNNAKIFSNPEPLQALLYDHLGWFTNIRASSNCAYNLPTVTSRRRQGHQLLSLASPHCLDSFRLKSDDQTTTNKAVDLDIARNATMK